jgi:thiamine biosynthesis lipoprotein
LKRLILCGLALILLISVPACGKKTTRYRADFLELFDTQTTIVAYTDSREEFDRLAHLIYDGLKEYHQLYDIYNDYPGINNLKTINDSAGVSQVKVDARIIDLLLFGKEAYKLSGGKLNIALGSVLKIWHRYRADGVDDPQNAALPAREELEKAAAHADIDDVIIDKAASTVFLKDPDMRLDVGAVAKGYAVEQVCRLAAEKGCTSALISVGGNIRAIGRKDGTQPWNVGVQNPDRSSEDSVLKTINLADASLVTSGNYERYYTVKGKRYHHIIDPATLFPSEYFASVSIVCKDSGMADARSTTLFNLPLEQGRKLVDSLPDAGAMWVYDDGTIKYSERFEALVRG